MRQDNQPESPHINATSASLLGFLHGGPMTGWKLVAVAREQIGNFWNLTRSQVYRELNALESHRLVTAGDRGARDSRQFEITPAGQAAFATWIEQMPGEEIIRFPLLLSTTFMGHLPPKRFRAVMERHREIHRGRLEGYKATLEDLRRQGVPPQAHLSLDFGIAYERMVLGWIDESLSTLSG